MKKLKYMITFIIILILILFLTLILVKNKKVNNVNEKNNIDNNTYNITMNNIYSNNEEISITKVTDNKTFYTVENCIKKFESYVNLNYKQQVNELGYPSIAANYKIATEEEKKKALLDLLNQTYIYKNNINEENVFQYVNATEKETQVEAIQINKIEDSNNISTYTAYIKKQSEGKLTYIYYVISIENNAFFCIYPININEYQSINDIKKVDRVNSIESNNRNTIVESYMDDGKIVSKYFNEYKELLINNKKEAYIMLNSNYSKKKFTNEEDFESYINKNIDKIKLMQIYEYKLNKESDYNEYVVKGSYNSVFIFIETEPKKYTVMLDDYTIYTNKFIKEYNNSTDIVKVKTNIENFIKMFNNKDYHKAYTCLNDTLKNESFISVLNFENYLRSKFYDINSITIESVKKQDNYYICSTKIINAKNKGDKAINMQVYMKLGEGADFEMSFSID